MGSETYHEPYELLSDDTRQMHRALVSLMEELEAVDWYQQRADACTEPELRDILIHNKNEEIEHAMMTLEWIRRRSPEFDQEMRTYLFTDRPILEAEDTATNGDPVSESRRTERPLGPKTGTATDGSLGIRRLG